jgi:hypothetical protein
MTINTLHQQKIISSALTLGINQTFSVDAAAVVNGSTVYRKVLFLRLPADAQAAQLVLKEFLLAVTFSANTFNIGSGSGFLQPQGWRQKDGKTIIRFNRAWPIGRISSNSHNVFALYRVDGDAVNDEATTTGTTNHDLNGDFVSHEFAVELSSVSAPQLDIAIGVKNVSTRALAKKSSPISSASAGVGNFVGVIDNAATVNIIGLRSVGILGMPSTPRIGIVQDVVTDAGVEAGNYAAGKIDWLSLISGEHPASVIATIAADVLPRVQAVIDDKFASANADGNTVILPLVFESDAPCRCVLNQLQINYALRSNLFGDAQSEQTLRFAGAAIDNQKVALKLPAGVIESVSMEINDAAQDQLAVDVSTEAAQRKSSSGAAINAQQAVAARVTLAAATVVRGISIAVNVLTEATSLEVTLLEDRNGTPSGGVLASAATRLDRIGTRQFVNILFKAPHTQLLLDQKPCWLLLRATAGSVLWLAAPTAPQKVLLLKDLQSTSGGVSQAARAIPGLALDYGWILNRDDSAGSAIDISLSIERQPVLLQVDSSNTRRHTLQLPPSMVQPVTETPVALTVTRASAGVVGLSALQIDYLPHA